MKTRLLLSLICGCASALTVLANPTVSASVSDNVSSSSQYAPAYSGSINDVVKLSHSGVDQSVVLEFVKNSNGPFHPSADEIIRLRDEGVSSPVITAMLQRDGELRTQAPQAPAYNYAQSGYGQSAQPAPAQPAADYTDAQPAYSAPASTVVYSYPSYPVYNYPTYYGGYYYPSYYSGYYPGYCYPRSYYGGYGYPHFGFYAPHFSVGFGFHGGGFNAVHVGGGFHSGFHGGVAFHGGGGFHGGSVGGHSGGFHGGFHH